MERVPLAILILAGYALVALAAGGSRHRRPARRLPAFDRERLITVYASAPTCTG